MRAVITGATSGIGRAFARSLAEAHHDLILTGRRSHLLEQFADNLRESCGVHVLTIVGDLTLPEVENRVVRAIGTAQPDVLVNNAGAGQACDFAETDPDEAARLAELLAGVPGRLTRAALPGMIDAKGGTIVNVGSLAGRLAVPGSAVYVASKSYLERLSESLALELARHGIVVQGLLPGYVRTDFHRAVPDFRDKQRSRGVIRWMEPEDVVEVSLRAVARARRRLEHRPHAIPRPRDVVVIPGALNALLAGIARVAPRRTLYRAAAGRHRLR